MERRFLDCHQVVILSDGKIILHTALSSKVKSDAIGDASQVVLAFNRRHLDMFGISAGIDARDGEVCLDHGIWTHSEPISTTAFSDILDKYLESVDAVMDELLDAISPFLPRLLDDDSSHENLFRRFMPRFPTDDGDDDEDDDDGDGDDSSIDWSVLFSHLSEGSENES